MIGNIIKFLISVEFNRSIRGKKDYSSRKISEKIMKEQFKKNTYKWPINVRSMV